MTIQPHRPGIPADILEMSHQRDMLRKQGDYTRADALKAQIEEAGYAIKDNPRGAHLVILPSIDVDGTVHRTVRQMPSLLKEPNTCQFSVNIVARNQAEQVEQCIESVLRYAGDHQIEIILVDNASNDDLSIRADTLRVKEPRLHVLRSSRTMGEAEARNAAMKRSQGHYILFLDSSVELIGDLFTPLAKTLSEPEIGVTGLRGLYSEDMRHFEESAEPEVDVIDGLCLAFPRALLQQIELLDEGYRFAPFLDIDLNFALKDTGVRTVVTPDLPVKVNSLPRDSRLSEVEVARLTRRNFYRFLDRWGDRYDLLLYQEDEEEYEDDEDDEGDEQA